MISKLILVKKQTDNNVTKNGRAFGVSLVAAARAEANFRHAVLPGVKEAYFHFLTVLFLRRSLRSPVVHLFLILHNDDRPQALNDDGTNQHRHRCLCSPRSMNFVLQRAKRNQVIC